MSPAQTATGSATICLQICHGSHTCNIPDIYKAWMLDSVRSLMVESTRDWKRFLCGEG
jgi:hypothetical protein